MKKSEQESFVKVAQADAGFQKFLDTVSPRRPDGVQEVFIAELFLILQILWEIYQILKRLGFFKAWFQTIKVKAAMKASSKEKKLAYLDGIKRSLIQPV